MAVLTDVQRKRCRLLKIEPADVELSGIELVYYGKNLSAFQRQRAYKPSSVLKTLINEVTKNTFDPAAWDEPYEVVRSHLVRVLQKWCFEYDEALKQA